MTEDGNTLVLVGELGLWMRLVVTSAGRIKLAGAALGLVAVVAVVIAVLAGALSPAQSEVFRRYNDSLVRHDLGTAYRLICEVDRRSLTPADFEFRYNRAVQPLGGLAGWNALRGGPQWIGRKGTGVTRMPRITDSKDPCVRATANPLGDRF